MLLSLVASLSITVKTVRRRTYDKTFAGEPGNTRSGSCCAVRRHKWISKTEELCLCPLCHVSKPDMCTGSVLEKPFQADSCITTDSKIGARYIAELYRDNRDFDKSTKISIGKILGTYTCANTGAGATCTFYRFT